MTDSKDPNASWGMDAFLENLSRWERQYDARANQMMGTEVFSAWMNQMQQGQFLMQQAFSEFLGRQLANANLPSRDDVVRLSEMVRKLDRRVEGLEQKLDVLAAEQPAAKSRGKRKTQRPARTKRPASVLAAEAAAEQLAAEQAAAEQAAVERAAAEKAAAEKAAAKRGAAARSAARKKAAEKAAAEKAAAEKAADQAAVTSATTQTDVDALASTIERIDEVLADRAAEQALLKARERAAATSAPDETIKGAA
ncbi:MAG: hypothetical protein AAF515_21780 [Pseudomonadota bacterium]